jgi:hypothetical protein
MIQVESTLCPLRQRLQSKVPWIVRGQADGYSMSETAHILANTLLLAEFVSVPLASLMYLLPSSLRPRARVDFALRAPSPEHVAPL